MLRGEIKNYIIDTDIGGDCDDTIALAMLNIACKNKTARMLAATHSTNIRYGCACIKAINNYYGNDCPIGACKHGKEKWYQDTYATKVAKKFCDEGYENYQDADKVIEDTLKAQTDSSVYFICVGPLTNIGSFLNTSERIELFNRKVKKMYIMGGQYWGNEPIKEYNISHDIEASRKLLNLYIKDAVFIDFFLGSLVKTGQKLTDINNPVCFSFKEYGTNARESWDPITVLYALEENSDLFSKSPSGTLKLDDNGITVFEENHKGKHVFLKMNCEPEIISEIINNYLI